MLGLGQSWSQSMVTEINPTVKQQRGLCWWDHVVYGADETNTIQEVQFEKQINVFRDLSDTKTLHNIL